MKDSYEEYVVPPSYTDSQGSDDPLIAKLRTRVHQDLNQINGVYDIRITDAEEKKRNMIEKLEKEYTNIISSINNQRNKDINAYKEKAEHYIDDLISNMNNSPQQIVIGWWDKLINYI
jgi:hypothetical protein